MKKLLSTLLLSVVAVAGYSQGSPAARPATTGTVETVTSAVYYVPPDVMRWFVTNRIPTSNTIFSIVQFVIGTNGGAGGVSTNIGAFAPLSMEIIGGSNIFKFSGGVTNLQPGTFWPNGTVSNADITATRFKYNSMRTAILTNILPNTNVLTLQNGPTVTVLFSQTNDWWANSVGPGNRWASNAGGFYLLRWNNTTAYASNSTAEGALGTWVIAGTNSALLSTVFAVNTSFGNFNQASPDGMLLTSTQNFFYGNSSFDTNVSIGGTTWHAGPVNISGTNQSGYVFKILGANGISFFGLDQFGGITYNTYEYMNANAFATHIPAFSQSAMKGWTADVHHGINSLGYSTDGNPMYSLTNTYWWMHWTSVGGSQAGAETTNQFFPIGRSALRMENWGGLLLQNPSVGYTSIATGFTSNSADTIDFPVLRWNDSKLLDRTNFADAAIPTNWFMLKSEFGNTIIGSYNPNDPTNFVNRPIVLNTNGQVTITNLAVPYPVGDTNATPKSYVDQATAGSSNSIAGRAVRTLIVTNILSYSSAQVFSNQTGFDLIGVGQMIVNPGGGGGTTAQIDKRLSGVLDFSQPFYFVPQGLGGGTIQYNTFLFEILTNTGTLSYSNTDAGGSTIGWDMKWRKLTVGN